MEILYLLVALSLGIALVVGVIFWWALGSGQFDDLDTPGLSVLLDQPMLDPPQIATRYCPDNQPHEQEAERGVDDCTGKR
ncbi:MAG: cbb3-type cytochrome oxidase assembly protein CcoS [Burkholderiales bacterium]